MCCCCWSQKRLESRQLELSFKSLTMQHLDQAEVQALLQPPASHPLILTYSTAPPSRFLRVLQRSFLGTVHLPLAPHIPGLSLQPCSNHPSAFLLFTRLPGSAGSSRAKQNLGISPKWFSFNIFALFFISGWWQIQHTSGHHKVFL